MSFPRLPRFRPLTASERAVREHATWLSRALRGRAGHTPRIPVRKVSEGGFAALLHRPGGRRTAEAWWARALREPR